MQSAALITLFHNSSKKKHQTSPQMTTLRNLSISPVFSQSILFHHKLPSSLSRAQNLPDSFPVWRKAESVTDGEDFCLAGEHTTLGLPRAILKSIKTPATKLMKWHARLPATSRHSDLRVVASVHFPNSAYVETWVPLVELQSSMSPQHLWCLAT